MCIIELGLVYGRFISGVRVTRSLVLCVCFVSIRTIVERAKINIPKRRDRSFALLGTCTSINSLEVKLDLWAKPPILMK
jgi:hypothetical protein